MALRMLFSCTRDKDAKNRNIEKSSGIKRDGFNNNNSPAIPTIPRYMISIIATAISLGKNLFLSNCNRLYFKENRYSKLPSFFSSPKIPDPRKATIKRKNTSMLEYKRSENKILFGFPVSCSPIKFMIKYTMKMDTNPIPRLFAVSPHSFLNIFPSCKPFDYFMQIQILNNPIFPFIVTL